MDGVSLSGTRLGVAVRRLLSGRTLAGAIVVAGLLTACFIALRPGQGKAHSAADRVKVLSSGEYLLPVLRKSANSELDQVVKLPGQIYETGRADPLQWKVRLLNQTGSRLEIADPTASCGCTGVTVESKDLGPDESTLLTMNVRPENSNAVRSSFLQISAPPP